MILILLPFSSAAEGRRIHPQKSAGTAIDNSCTQIAQFLRVRVQLRQWQDRLIGIEGENPNQKVLIIGWVAPKYVMPIGIERPSARNPRHYASRFQVSARKGILCREPVLARTLEKDVAIEHPDDLERGVEKSPFEAELHQHQQHGKADTAARS
jgi:hypothetical protein